MYYIGHDDDDGSGGRRSNAKPKSSKINLFNKSWLTKPYRQYKSLKTLIYNQITKMDVTRMLSPLIGFAIGSKISFFLSSRKNPNVDDNRALNFSNHVQRNDSDTSLNDSLDTIQRKLLYDRMIRNQRDVGSKSNFYKSKSSYHMMRILSDVFHDSNRLLKGVKGPIPTSTVPPLKSVYVPISKDPPLDKGPISTSNVRPIEKAFTQTSRRGITRLDSLVFSRGRKFFEIMKRVSSIKSERSKYRASNKVSGRMGASYKPRPTRSSPEKKKTSGRGGSW